MKTTSTFLTFAAVAIVALSGCGSDTAGRQTSDAGTGANRPVDTSEPSRSATSTKQPNPKFGQAYTYEDGLVVTVSAPAPFTPSESASTSTAGSYVVFDVTVVNGSADNYEPSELSATLQSDNLEADQVFDSAQGISSPSTVVLPGRETAFKMVFKVNNPADLVMAVSPSYDHKKAIFTT